MEVIWGVAVDNSLDTKVKITVLLPPGCGLRAVCPYRARLPQDVYKRQENLLVIVSEFSLFVPMDKFPEAE